MMSYEDNDMTIAISRELYFMNLHPLLQKNIDIFSKIMKSTSNEIII